jgi:hypothetical protein
MLVAGDSSVSCFVPERSYVRMHCDVSHASAASCMTHTAVLRHCARVVHVVTVTLTAVADRCKNR